MGRSKWFVIIHLSFNPGQPGFGIGKGGETIKRLASETGAKIQFKPDGQCLYFYLNKS
jgi:polyribonucleotide nucleotidyltransferase